MHRSTFLTLMLQPLHPWSMASHPIKMIITLVGPLQHRRSIRVYETYTSSLQCSTKHSYWMAVNLRQLNRCRAGWLSIVRSQSFTARLVTSSSLYRAMMDLSQQAMLQLSVLRQPHSGSLADYTHVSGTDSCSMVGATSPVDSPLTQPSHASRINRPPHVQK